VLMNAIFMVKRAGRQFSRFYGEAGKRKKGEKVKVEFYLVQLHTNALSSSNTNPLNSMNAFGISRLPCAWAGAVGWIGMHA
jgi:hypothetical protein